MVRWFEASSYSVLSAIYGCAFISISTEHTAPFIMPAVHRRSFVSSRIAHAR